ncbi:unnamed protein product [Sphagnum tenellum]
MMVKFLGRDVRPLASQADQCGHRRRADHGQATPRLGDAHGPRGRASHLAHLVPTALDGCRRQGRRPRCCTTANGPSRCGRCRSIYARRQT